MSHTATPWLVQNKGIRCLIRGADGTIVALRHRLPGKTHEANAEFIVRACNCHDGLLEACKAALYSGTQADGMSDETIDKLESAIARAEGKPDA